MNEEEKERIKHLIERCNECKLNTCITCDITWSEVQAIEKQQAEIEDWKTDYNYRCQLAIDRKIELEKKDKIIDLMAEYISNLDIEDDICIKNTTNTDLCYEDYTKCKECVIEHFNQKIEKGE